MDMDGIYDFYEYDSFALRFMNSMFQPLQNAVT